MSVEFYERNACNFIADTADVDMSALYKRFCKYLPVRASVLDAGCGSGRDALAFSRMGHDVVGFDASARMVAAASKLASVPVYKMTFQDMEFDRQFDGIWACASLLHVPRTQLLDVVRSLAEFLTPTGVLYASFKYGTQEREKGGRYFNDMDEAHLDHLASRVQSLRVLESWTTADQRPNRGTEKWLNVIFSARPDPDFYIADQPSV